MKWVDATEPRKTLGFSSEPSGIPKGANSMALGVLNNLSAIYAGNNLNNTNNSLQNVLRQLSSGSRINSGADDAAGLSLVNGLQANTRALSQSATNATEGVGLLQVADGALSQVTNLLNRAITLATEASNGTLNTSQLSAANQEYQSILSEINNIGSTTTYNQNRVFTGDIEGVAIYTGDSSAAGASINSLFFAKLSSSSLGDTGGVVQQNSNGVFVDLSLDSGGANNALTQAATLADVVTAGLSFITTNPDGTTTTFTTASLSVGALIQEINAQKIPGVLASFTTAGLTGNASSTVDAMDTGIQLTNTNPNVTIAIGTLTDTTSGAQSLNANTAAMTTIGYKFAAGGDHSANLANTDLTSQVNAQNAVAVVNAAITDISSMDGYLGAQINTLNAISQVMSTQQENIVSAQDAIQATDFATATSNMSKFQILSQTGIAALAQANSIQQEVTKLLQ
jgi:flagellin